MKRYSFILAGLFFLLVSCGKNPNNDSAFAPVVNPTPKYFMTVKGFIDPNLPKNLNLQIQAYYTTNNESCEYDSSGGFSGAMTPRTRWIKYSPKTDIKGNYQINVAIDYFTPSKCNWSLSYIQYQYKNIGSNNGESSVFVYFAQNGKGEEGVKQGKEVLRCDSNNCADVEFIPLGNSYGDLLSPNFNYVYELSFIYNEKNL